MRVHERLGDTARNETDNDIPDKVKDIFPFESRDLGDGTQQYQSDPSEAMRKCNVVFDRFL